MTEIWNCKCKDCVSFKKDGGHYWCVLENKSVMPYTQACGRYAE